jgi:CubicO group peptidase (beta-lactamase class C family)
MISADPESVGLSTERLARVDALTHGYVDSGRLPCGLTVIARHGEVVYHDVYGWADLDADRKLTDDAIFRIYSMTKPITSVALMQLYERGDVLLENAVSRYIPSFADIAVWDDGTADDYTTVPTEREITVHDVLTHQAGFTAGFQYQTPVDELYRRHGLGDLVRPDIPLDEAMDRLASLPVEFQPGSRWAYGMSSDVCGRIVEVVSGQSLDEYLRDHILDPLGMVDTGFWVPESEIDRLTTNYARNKAKKLRPIDSIGRTRYDRPPTYLSGAGGLVSTAADYQRFVQMLANRGQLDGTRVIGSRTLDYMTLNHLPGGTTLNERGQSTFAETAMDGVGFGLGFSVVVDPAATHAVTSIGNYGWGGAASTIFWVDPVDDLTAMFLTQLLPSNTFPIRRQLQATVAQALID